MLTGFVKVTDAQKEQADKAHRISTGSSAFQPNVVFQVNGYGYKKAEKDGKVDADAPFNPILTTTIGVDVFLSMITRARVDSDGKILEPNGTFNNFVKKTIAQNGSKSDGEILQAIVNGVQGKDIIVTRKPYVGLSSDNRRYPAALVILDFKD